MQATTGVLIEARVLALRTRADADDYARALAMQVQAFSVRTRPILRADHRPVVIYPQEVAERLVELFVDMNSRLDRVAIVVARSNATMTLQLERMVREAAFEKRRSFHAP